MFLIRPALATCCIILPLAGLAGCSEEPDTDETAAAAAPPPAAEATVEASTDRPLVTDGYSTARAALTAMEDALAGRQWTQLWWIILASERTGELARLLDVAAEVSEPKHNPPPDARASLETLLKAHDLTLQTGPGNPELGRTAREKPPKGADALFDGVMGWLDRHIGDSEAAAERVMEIEELVVAEDAATATLAMGEARQPVRLQQDAEGRWYVAPGDGLVTILATRLAWTVPQRAIEESKEEPARDAKASENR